jgi:prephenate dehydrogenase
MSRGNHQVILCERGIRTFETATRNTLDLSAVPVLKQLTHLPVVVDPSHGVGKWDLVAPMAKAAVAAGADGLLIEVHTNPEEAMSDGEQSLKPDAFRMLMEELRPIAILGVGLIGASFALALKKRALCGSIAGFGRNESNLLRARERGVIDLFDLDPARASADADLVLFAMHVGSFTETARRIAATLKTGAVVTDVGSVKGNLVYEMQSIVSPQASFVGAHPIAGGERSGIEKADADLFDGRRCIITPTDATDGAAMETMVTLWRFLGAEVVTMGPSEHDRVLGAVSHLPHIIAYEMVNAADEINESYLGYSGTGFRDVTRIASSSPELWRDVCMLNRDNLIHFLDLFIGRLEAVRGYMVSADAESLQEEFRKAKMLRDGLGQD